MWPMGASVVQLAIAVGSVHGAASWEHALWRWPGWAAITAFGTLLLFGGVVVAIVAIWQGRRAIEEDRNAAQLGAVAALIGEHRSPEMRAARQRIWLLRNRRCKPDAGYSQFSNEEREAFERVTHFLDSIGLLVHQELLELAHARTYFGLSILNMWLIAGPYVYSERRRAAGQGGDQLRMSHLRHFEDLAARVRDKKSQTIWALNELDKFPPDGQVFVPTPGGAPPPRRLRRGLL